MVINYILVNHDPVVEPDIIKWSLWMENIRNRIVKYSQLDREVLVSTVFLGTDHNNFGGEPVLFETMIYWGKVHEDEYQERYHTWDEAVEGHEKALKIAKEVLSKI